MLLWLNDHIFFFLLFVHSFWIIIICLFYNLKLKLHSDLPSAAWSTPNSRPLNVLLASSCRAHRGDVWLMRVCLDIVMLCRALSVAGSRWILWGRLTVGLLRMSAMLKGVKGLLELAGGGRWSRGFIPRLSIASHILTTLVVVIQAFANQLWLQNSCFREVVSIYIYIYIFLR